RSEAVSGRGSSNAISIIPRPPRGIQMPGQAAGSCVRRIGLVPQRQSPFCPRAETGWMPKRHRTISSVPNFVDLATGGWGAAIQDPLNSSQTPTMANFATLADALAGCVTRVMADACTKLYTATVSPKGDTPNDTLMAAQSIARAPWYQPTRV